MSQSGNINQDVESALKLLQKWASENYVSLEKLIPGSESEQKRLEKNRNTPRVNETSKLANDYRTEVMNFKSKNKLILDQFRQNKFSHSELGLSSDILSVEEIERAFQSIYTEESQLAAKITNGYLVAATPGVSESDLHQAGTKILLGIDLSLVAWATVVRQAPLLKEQCWKFLVLLDRIRKRISTDFPQFEASSNKETDELVKR